VTTKRNLFLLFLLILAFSARSEPVIPANATAMLKSAFPGCEIQWSSVGPLYRADSQDVASSLSCQSDEKNDSEGSSGPYGLVVLSEEGNGAYRIAYQARGLLLYFAAEIKKRSLFLHTATGSYVTDTTYDYQFRLDGRNLVLIGLELDASYKNPGKPPKDLEYHISANYLTRMVVDSRISKGKQRRPLPKVTLEEFNFEPGVL
jgi:hypothetical protein